MNKPLLNITADASGQQGRINIIGDISCWGDNSSDILRAACQQLKDAKVGNCTVYLNTCGGECFEANEIVNILSEFFPGYTGEGGAIVASAGTYIAVTCKTFNMAQNGQFMVHKPSGYINGNEQEINNYLSLLRNMTQTYYAAYIAKCKKPENEFKAKWDGGDFWMSAKEAQDWGFVTDIKGPETIDEPTALLIKASGSPIQVQQSKNNKEEMELKMIAIAIGMPQDATEPQVNTRLAELKQKADQYDVLKANMEKKEKEEKSSKIKSALDKAILDKRIQADSRKNWEQLLDQDYENTEKLLNSLQPVQKLSSKIENTPNKGVTYQGKTFEELQDEDPDMLAELEDNDPETFKGLFSDYKKRNKIK